MSDDPDGADREDGRNDEPSEDVLVKGFDNVVTSGAERLHRSASNVLVTGLFGGLEVGLGIMGYLAVLHQTNDHLLAGLAFGAGFIALMLAHSELFTENFLMPIAAVVAKQGTLLQLAKLWGGTLVGNLVGGWVFMWLLAQGFPQWKPTMVEAATHYAHAPFSLQSVVLAVLAGSTITLMTRMQQGTDSHTAKIVASVIGGFLLAGLQLFHSILDSLLIFGGIHVGGPVTYLQWLGWFAYTLVGNVIGGVVLVTALRLVRTRHLVADRRRDPVPAARE
jgi:formate/nitrite transporter FocA (FNT family)